MEQDRFHKKRDNLGLLVQKDEKMLDQKKGQVEREGDCWENT